MIRSFADGNELQYSIIWSIVCLFFAKTAFKSNTLDIVDYRYRICAEYGGLMSEL
jgi:hypothetical protein